MPPRKSDRCSYPSCTPRFDTCRRSSRFLHVTSDPHREALVVRARVFCRREILTSGSSSVRLWNSRIYSERAGFISTLARAQPFFLPFLLFFFFTHSALPQRVNATRFAEGNRLKLSTSPPCSAPARLRIAFAVSQPKANFYVARLLFDAIGA